MRIFIGIDLDPEVRARIERFLEGVEGFAPDARWVRPESLHITLKFIGEKPPEAVDSLKEALGGIHDPPFGVALRGFGFFPTSKSPRVFWARIQAGPELQKLAAGVDDIAGRLGVLKEEHAFSPHLTLARKGSGSGA